MDWLQMERWSPYLVGIGIGLLNGLALLLSDKPIGCSAAFSRTSGMIEKVFRGKIITEKAYYRKFSPSIEWDWMLVVGVFVGALISAWLSGQSRLAWVPNQWAGRFGDTSFLRGMVALVGGIIMGIGARWAGGCTSGHGIGGTLQLAVSSWLAAICFFVGGVLTAMMLFQGF